MAWEAAPCFPPAARIGATSVKAFWFSLGIMLLGYGLGARRYTVPGSCSAIALSVLRGEFLPPLVLSLWMAGMDLACRRIPNYLTLGGALAGLGFQFGRCGWPGLLDGLGGAAVGFFLLFWIYLKGGMGAGDVKALTALGAWLGLENTLYLFIYMGLSGGLIVIGVLIWQGRLRSRLREVAAQLVNRLLCHSHPESPARTAARRLEIPYGAALALGMACLWGRQFLGS